MAVRVHVLIDSLAVGGAETLLAVGSILGRRDRRAVRDHVRRSAPDLIHTHLDYADLLGGLAARSLGIPAVSTLHVAEWRGDLRQRVRLRVVAGARRRCADRVIAVSEAARQSYLAHGWDRPERVVAVHNGIVDIPSADSGEAIRSELGIGPSELVIGMVSVLRGGKGHDVAAAAVRRLLTRFGGLRLVVAGDGPQRSEIEARMSGLGDRVIFTGHRPDVDRILGALDVLVHPSVQEAFPTALLEAMRSGVPVVASNVGGIPEAVADGETGFLIDAPPTGEALAGALEPLLADPELRRELGRRARRRFEADFTVGRWLERLLPIYEEAIARRTPSSPGDGARSAMRVAYVVSLFPHVSETFIVRELDAVSATGEVEIELLSLFPAVAETIHPAAEPWVRRLQRATVGDGLAALVWWLFRRPLRLAAGPPVRGAPRAGRPIDHVHAHYATYPALAAWLCGRLLGVGYSFTAHAHDIYLDQSMLARKIADARFVVTISDFNRDWLRPFAGNSQTPIEVVHCGIDLAEYEYRGRSLPAQGPVGAFCVASLQEYKGHTVLLRALASDPRLGRVRVELVGEGRLRPSLERLAAELGIADRITFTGGLREAEVRDRLAAADLFVLPSIIASDGQMEGLPVVLMEAMASGVPVVATRLSGIPELVVDGETGLLAEPGDPVALSRALARVLEDDPDEVMRRVAAGRERVERAFDLRETGERMAALFAAAVRRFTAPRAPSRCAPRSPAS